VTPDQFREALDSLGLTQAGAARPFRIPPRTIRRWAKEGCEGLIVIVLRLLLADRVTIRQVDAAAEAVAEIFWPSKSG
jgi:hypothetical protein